MVALNNSQSTASNSVAQKGEEHKKMVYRKMNNTARNKTEKCNPRNGFQNSCTKLKMSDENYCSPCNGKYF